MTDNVIDLDQERESRAAQREGSGKPMTVKLGGEIIAELPIELPFDVLVPLRDIAGETMLLISHAMNVARQADGSQISMDAAATVIDILASSASDLPARIVDVVKKVATALLGEDGVRKLLDQRPSVHDLAALAKAVMSYYGVSLGEASTSSDSSISDGGTSSTTSRPTSTDSMPADSLPAPEPQAS